MKYNKRSCFSFFFAMFMVINVYNLRAQETVTTAGGNATGSGGTVSYTIGQAAYSTYSNVSGTVAQGVQQPFEIFVVTGIEEAKGINLSVTAYPNPTADCLTLSITEFDISNFSYQLYDMNGKLVQNEKISSNQTSIVVSDLVPATYLVKVIQGNKEVKTFKIIKN